MKKQQEILKNNFKSLRVRAGLNQEEAARELNISRTHFLKYENNPITVKLLLLLKLTGLYNCTISDFFIGIKRD